MSRTYWFHFARGIECFGGGYLYVELIKALLALDWLIHDRYSKPVE